MTLTCRLGLEIQECFLCLIISITEHLTIRIFKLNADQRNFCLTDIIRGDLKPRDIIREILFDWYVQRRFETERYYPTDILSEKVHREFFWFASPSPQPPSSPTWSASTTRDIRYQILGQPQQQEISSSTRLSSVNKVQTIKVHWWWLRLISNLHTHHTIWYSST